MLAPQLQQLRRRTSLVKASGGAGPGSPTTAGLCRQRSCRRQLRTLCSKILDSRPAPSALWAGTPRKWHSEFGTLALWPGRPRRRPAGPPRGRAHTPRRPSCRSLGVPGQLRRGLPWFLCGPARVRLKCGLSLVVLLAQLGACPSWSSHDQQSTVAGVVPVWPHRVRRLRRAASGLRRPEAVSPRRRHSCQLQRGPVPGPVRRRGQAAPRR